MKSAIVIGAGLAGLQAARTLTSAGIQVTVLEESDRVGGRVTSDLIDGFICDRGFQVINPSYPEVARTNLIPTLDFQSINPNLRIQDGGSEFLVGLNHPFPLIFTTFKRRKELFNEFFTGVFLANPDLISTTVKRSIMKSFLFGRPGVPARGVGEFSKALAAGLADVRFAHRVERVEGKSVIGNFGRLDADAIVIATTAATANTLLNLYMPHQMSSSTTWYHTTKDELSSPAYMAIPTKSAIVNSVAISQISQSYAPLGSHLVATTTLNSVSEDRIKEQLAHIWGTSKWEHVTRYEIRDSLPFMSKGSARPIIRASESVVLAGDYLQLPSQQGAMTSGRLAAEELTQLRR